MSSSRQVTNKDQPPANPSTAMPYTAIPYTAMPYTAMPSTATPYTSIPYTAMLLYTAQHLQPVVRYSFALWSNVLSCTAIQFNAI